MANLFSPLTIGMGGAMAIVAGIAMEFEFWTWWGSLFAVDIHLWSFGCSAGSED
jgi:hypothetical protein